MPLRSYQKWLTTTPLDTASVVAAVTILMNVLQLSLSRERQMVNSSDRLITSDVDCSVSCARMSSTTFSNVASGCSAGNENPTAQRRAPFWLPIQVNQGGVSVPTRRVDWARSSSLVG